MQDKIIESLNQTTAEDIKDTNSKKGATFGVQTDSEDWYGKEIQAQSTPLMDPGLGKSLVLRCFEFSVNPEFKGVLNKQELFNMHWRQIQAVLWGDGLVPNEDAEPRVILGNKKYKIFILCQPRLRTIINEKAQTIQDIIHRKK
jgi:hypothetical protein